jgi:hypothetical protein
MGGEAVSLAMTHPSAQEFRSAGYQSLSNSNTSLPGVVRQHNTLSFTRVFDAGHAVGAYQPETVSRIFERVMFDKDVATGSVEVGKNGSYSSVGLESSFGIKNVAPESLKNGCYLWDVVNTCTQEEVEALKSGNGTVRDYILVKS